MNDENSIKIGPLEWSIGDISLDKSGIRLVVVSLDGIYINVYTTVNTGGCNSSPI